VLIGTTAASTESRGFRKAFDADSGKLALLDSSTHPDMGHAGLWADKDATGVPPDMHLRPTSSKEQAALSQQMGGDFLSDLVGRRGCG